MNCFISINSTNKAKTDIDALMLDMGFRDLSIHGWGHGHVETFFRKVLSMVNILFRLHRGDVLLIQYPFKKFFVAQCKIAHLKGAKTITLIHDLGAFRRKKLTAEQENRRLSHTDCIIAHNDSMKRWIEDNGYGGAVVSLDIFDYLSGVALNYEREVQGSQSVVYAGGLGERKNAFLYDVGRAMPDMHIDLYGDGDLDKSRFPDNVTWHGRIPSEEFIANVRGRWGLVWDGDSTDACNGIWGEYLRLNNPHKTSFYLRAGLPVIVWKQAAMAPFILKNNIGVAIDNLSELTPLLSAISDDEYAQIKANVMNIQRQLQDGYFFKQAFRKAVSGL